MLKVQSDKSNYSRPNVLEIKQKQTKWSGITLAGGNSCESIPEGGWHVC